jgi:hypothetical protein
MERSIARRELGRRDARRPGASHRRSSVQERRCGDVWRISFARRLAQPSRCSRCLEVEDGLAVEWLVPLVPTANTLVKYGFETITEAGGQPSA